MHHAICLSAAVLAASIGQAMAREPSVDAGNVPAPNDGGQLQQIAAQEKMAMSPTDIASLNCDALKDGKLE